MSLQPLGPLMLLAAAALLQALPAAAEREIPDYSMPGGVSGNVFEKTSVGSGPVRFPSTDSYAMPVLSTDPIGNSYARSCVVSHAPVIGVSCN